MDGGDDVPSGDRPTDSDASRSDRGDEIGEPSPDDSDGTADPPGTLSDDRGQARSGRDETAHDTETHGERPESVRGWLHWLRTTDNGTVVFAREMASSIAIVAVIGLLLFAISGVWPPMVAIESGSMEPQMYKGDLVFIMDNERFTPDAAQGDSGIVSAEAGEANGYESFNDHGHVIIFQPDGLDRTPIIHRSMLWVEEDEDWLDRANPEYVPRNDANCDELPNCPAPHDGFITKGDNNPHYDQVGHHVLSSPVKPEWVIGTAELRVPYLGWIRLYWAGILSGDIPGGLMDDPAQTADEPTQLLEESVGSTVDSGESAAGTEQYAAAAAGGDESLSANGSEMIGLSTPGIPGTAPAVR